MNIDEKANDIRHMFEARLITRKEYGELIRKMEAEFDEQKRQIENALCGMCYMSRWNSVADYMKPSLIDCSGAVARFATLFAIYGIA